MADEYGRYGERHDQDSDPKASKGQTDDMDKRIEEIRRAVTQGANEAQGRLKRVLNRATDYWQQAQTPGEPKQANSVEEQRIRQLANIWSNENWRVARDLGNYMEVVSWGSEEVWEATLQTRWETRTMEIISEPYTGRQVGMPKPLLPVWDYELPAVVGLKAPQTRTRLEGLDEIVGCTNCNGNGRVLCAKCTGRGWIVCPDCKGRTKKRCTTCRGRGFIADPAHAEKKPFLKKQAENVANSVTGKVADVVDTIRQQGVPIPNSPANEASKGPTIPCPDCINGEVDCTCGNGKRVCPECEGARMSLCNNCGGTGKVVRHREIVRQFDMRVQTRIIGESPIPAAQLSKAVGDMVYNAEVSEPLHAGTPPENVPFDVWQPAVEMVDNDLRALDKPGVDPKSISRPTLQVLELVRIPYTKIGYRLNNQDYVLYIYDGEGREKFYAESYPTRWDRIERLVKAITTDLAAPAQPGSSQPEENGSSFSEGYRSPADRPPYSINEDDQPR